MIISVIVDAGAETMIVTGLSVKIYVAVMTSVIVSVRKGGTGVIRATGDGDGAIDDAGVEDIEDEVVICGSMEKSMPSTVINPELAMADMFNELTLATVVQFTAGVDPETASAIVAVETASVQAKKSNFESI